MMRTMFCRKASPRTSTSTIAAGSSTRHGALCDKCEGDDYNAPIEGMVVVWGLEDRDADGVWEHGKVFDPEKNKTYRCKIWMHDGNIKIRGYLGPFFRTQTWYETER